MSEDPLSAVKQHFGIRLKQVTATEYRSLNGCPECGDGGKGARSDRFRVFTDGSPRWWCRRCGFQGFVDEIDGEPWRDLNYYERRRRDIAARQRAEQEAERERQLRRQALQELRASGDAERYHRQLARNATALNYWFAEGFQQQTIQHFRLGYCRACPLDYQHRPSVTIPVTSAGLLWNIRHRILDAEPGDKYRPHTKHLPQPLFNADALRADSNYILIVEGEKKAMAAWQAGWQAVGICGQDTWREDWVPAFDSFERVYVILDPDATKNAQEIAVQFGHRGRVVELPDKLDDLLNPYKGGWSAERVWRRIQEAE